MKLSLPFCALLLPLLAATVPSGRVEASASILRCRSADGATVYTDKACSALGARAAPIPGALLARISHEQALEQRLTGIAPDSAAPAASAVPAVGRRSAAAGCARTPQQLERDVRGSLALGDVNRLAESYHWVGMRAREGNRVLDRLQRLLERPALDSHYFGAQIAMAGDAADAAATSLGGDGGMLQVVLGSGAAQEVVDFNVHRYAGCYFVAF